MDGRHGDDLKNTKRSILVHDFIRERGIINIEDASDELLKEADREADKILGKGKDD